MIAKMSNGILKFLERKCHIPASEHEVYLYGMDILLYTILSTAGLLGFGILCNRLIESIVIIALYYINQTLGSGFHATTHFKCFLTMVVGLMLCLAFLNLPFYKVAYSAIGCASIAFMFLHPLVLHKNKEYLKTQFKRLSTRSRVSLAIQLLCFAVAVLVDNEVLSQSMCAAFWACATSRLVAVCQRK